MLNKEPPEHQPSKLCSYEPPGEDTTKHPFVCSTENPDLSASALNPSTIPASSDHPETSNPPKELGVTLQLSGGVVALIDAEDLERVRAQGKWSANWVGWGYYPINRRGGPGTYLHRFILNAPAGVQVDHINFDTLDCRKENLRLCSHTQNSHNKPKPRIRVSGSQFGSQYKGVSRRGGRWQARISLKGIGLKNLGLYSTEEAAALAYNEAARRYHGEFARLNEIGGVGVGPTACGLEDRCSIQLSYPPTEP